MEKFNITQYHFENIFYDNKMARMLLTGNNFAQAIHDIQKINDFIPQACMLSKINIPFSIPIENLEFSTLVKQAGPQTYTQYYSYLECSPYTKTGKLSKYPLILHYATKNLDKYRPCNNYFGEIHYTQSGTVGKARLVCWLQTDMCVINLAMICGQLGIKTVESRDAAGNKIILYKTS